MADGQPTLFNVPMSFQPGETLLGSLGQGIGRATPELINPYMSTGAAVGISLGSVLLQSLLGYQARQQAAERTLELNRLSTALTSLPTAQERSQYLQGLGDTDPLVLGRLGSLAGALTNQELQQKQLLDLERSKKMLGLEVQLSPEAQQVAEQEQARELAQINARAAGFGAGLGVGDPEKNRIMQKSFGALNLASKTALNLLSPDEWKQLDEGTLEPSNALNEALKRQRARAVDPTLTGISEATAEKAAIQEQTINDVAKHVELIKSIPELGLQLAYKSPIGATALGKIGAAVADGELPEGFLARNQALIAQLRKDLFGSALTGLEAKSFDLVTGKEKTTSKADIIAAWEYIIERAKTRAAAKRKYVGLTKEEFTKGGETLPTPTPTAETGSVNKLAELEQLRKRRQDMESRLAAFEKALQEQKALQGQ